MSHISKYGHLITNHNLFFQVCKAKGYKVITGKQQVKSFGRNSVEAIGSIQIPGWRYPIALTEKGELQYDHFGSGAGTMEKLAETVQQYNELGTLEVVPWDQITNNYTETLENGDRKLVLEYA